MDTCGLPLNDLRELILALRESGAVKVRVGDVEVLWAPPGAARVAELPVRGSRAQEPPQRHETPEEQRLRQYRAELTGESV